MDTTKNRIAIISLCLACLALLFATVPPYIIENKIEKLKKVNHKTEPAISFEVKGVKLSFGSKKVKEKQIDNTRKIEKLNNLSQIFTVGLFIAGILAIFTGVYSWAKERNRDISVGSLLAACVALAWQYIAAGISIGVAVFILILLLANLG